MIDPKIFDDIASRLGKILPPEMRAFQDNMEKNFKSVLQSCFAKLDLVTRDEFDVQAAVLAKTRAKLENLEKQVSALEEHSLKKKDKKKTSD